MIIGHNSQSVTVFYIYNMQGYQISKTVVRDNRGVLAGGMEYPPGRRGSSPGKILKNLSSNAQF